MEKRPDGLSYLVDIDGRLAVRSRFFLKPVLQVGQGGDNDDDNQDQGEFHSSSTPSLRRSSRLVEKKEKTAVTEKCRFSCAPAPVIPTRTNSESSSGCSGCTDRTPRRQRTPSTSRQVGSRSSIYSGLHLPLGPQQSSSVRCSFLPCSSAAGSVPATSDRAGPAMASSSTSSGPLPVALPSPCRNLELFPAGSVPGALGFCLPMIPMGGHTNNEPGPIRGPSSRDHGVAHDYPVP